MIRITATALLVAALAAVWALVGPSSRASATTDNPVFSSFDEVLSLSTDGIATVNISATFDTGNARSAGPALSFPRRVRVTDQDGRPRWRELTNTVTQVSSDTGASTTLRHTTTVDTDLFRIGDQSNEFSGVHNYQVSLTIEGLVTPTESSDEFAWEAIDAVDTLARTHASFTVDAPGVASDVQCTTHLPDGPECPVTSDGNRITASVDNLDTADSVTITSDFPAGTFVDVKQGFAVQRTLADRFPLTPIDIIGGLALALIGIVGAIAFALTRARDRRWDSSQAGDTKPPPDTRIVAGRRRRVPVRTEPPEDARPGEVGYLMSTHTEIVQISATMIDLAVRGFLTVHHEDDSSWTFRRAPMDAADLSAYERTVLKRLFPKVEGRIRVTSSTGQVSRTKGSFATTREALARRVGAREWFRIPPEKARWRTHRLGVLICVFGLLSLVPFVGLMGLGLWSAGIVVAGLAVLVVMPFAPSRTPAGSAIYEQAEGFRQFLANPDPEQIDWKRSGDIFGRYLPWAVVFGVEDQWTDLFQHLTDDGAYRPQCAWYEPLHDSVWATQGKFEALSALASRFSESVAAADRHAAAVSGSDSD